MSESMVTRVAKVLAYETDPRTITSWGDWENLARKAITAMRIPSPKMLKAACKSMSPERRPTPNRVSVKAKHGIRYRAMIDAALEEGKQ